MTKACPVRTNKEKILARWVSISKERFPAASDKSREAVKDHLPQLVDLLCAVIETKTLESPREISKTHGRQRFSFGDYTLPQILGEYSILKNLVFDEMTSEPVDSLRLIDLFFDVATSTAATEFSTLREEELLKMTDQLKESNLDLERFAGVAAHDLRAPVATILGYSELLIESAVENPMALKSATTVGRTAKRMIDLIDQLLAYSRIGKTNLPFIRFSISKSVEDAIASLETAIQIAHAEIKVGPLPDISGDPVLFTQLFQNLIANSLKFRSPNRTCKILIESSVQNGRVKLTVSDNGLGFDPQLSANIFDPFVRAHEHLKIQGSGIGLATVERIVKLHHGQVSAEGHLDVGARFTMEFPVDTSLHI